MALISGDDSVRADPPGPRTECRRRLERMLTIGAEAAQLERRIADLVAATGTTLTEQHGVGSLVAARFISKVVDMRRYPNRNAFAAANGTAPTARLLRADHPAPLQPQRQRPDEPGPLHHRAHPAATPKAAPNYERQRSASKPKREALRCLKRRLADIVFTTMGRDAAQSHHPASSLCRPQ